MAEITKYEHIPASDSDHDETYRNPRQQRRELVSTLISFLAGLATMGLFAALLPVLRVSTQSHARNLPDIPEGSDPNTGLPLSWSHGDCGNSPKDAKSRDCRYSIILHAWLPQSCLAEEDAEDDKQMYQNSRWIFTSASGRNLTVDELGSGDYEHFVTAFDWHVTHCMYVWRRLHRVLMDPSQSLDSYTANYHHTSHCVNMISGNAGKMKDSGTKVFVKYPKCAK